MPDNIQVKVSNDGDIYCSKDPHRMEHHKERMIQWHSNKIEFVIKFLNGSPFTTGETELQSENKWTEEKEVTSPPPNGNAFVYEVLEQNSAGEQRKVDPGLIIDP